MKYALILPDGCADEPLAELDGHTPLEAARTPHMRTIAQRGRVGFVRTVPEGFPPGSDVATLSVVGYDPVRCYTGRAPLEAVAQRIVLEPGELVFRCNLVTLVDDVMEDFAAGHISQAEADKLIADLETALGDARIRFHPGVGYRHLMTIKDAEGMRVTCTPPHDLTGRPVTGHLPTGKGADVLIELMRRSQEILANHEVNAVRRDLGESPATSIWLWGQGTMPRLEPFRKRFGVRGAAITAVDLIRGISLSVGWKLIEVEGATGYIDTNYAGKGAAAVAALDAYDLVVVHVEAPDEAGHNGDAEAKVKALEAIDEHIVGPILDKLAGFERWRVLCLPDHPTPVRLKTHTADPVPFCMAGTGVICDQATAFTEQTGRDSHLLIDPGHELMEYFLKSGLEA